MARGRAWDGKKTAQSQHSIQLPLLEHSPVPLPSSSLRPRVSGKKGKLVRPGSQPRSRCCCFEAPYAGCLPRGSHDTELVKRFFIGKKSGIGILDREEEPLRLATVIDS